MSTPSKRGDRKGTRGREKCEKPGFIKLSEIIEGGNVIVSLSERSLGRVIAKDLKKIRVGNTHAKISVN